MASSSNKTSRPDTHVPHLRAAMGVRSPSGWCSVEGCDVAWEEALATPANSNLHPIVCLHDAGNGSREFRPLLQLLENSPSLPTPARLILIDWPGHGRSQSQPQASHIPLSLDRCVTVLESVINQLGLRRPILLGSGFGAAVAIQFAAKHPRRIRGIVACQPAGLFPEVWKRRSIWKATTHWINRLNPNPSPTPNPRQSHRVGLIGSIAQWNQWGQWDLIAEASASLQQASSSLRQALQTLPCPILFAFSRQSRAFPLNKYLALLDPLLKASPQHRFTVFSGEFSPIWDEPARFAQALDTFVQAQLPLHQHHHSWLLAAVDWPATGLNLWKCIHPECPEEKVLPTGQNANDPNTTQPQ